MFEQIPMKKRFGGNLPVVIDVETGGVNPLTDALLEIGVVFLAIGEDGKLTLGESLHFHVTPFPKSKISAESLQINKIKPDHPFRLADSEMDVLQSIFKKTRQEITKHRCARAVLVGHNAHFDLSFLHAATDRCALHNSPFHRFTCLDTATLGSAAFCHSVLARALQTSGIEYDKEQAHSARYDTEVTAQLFCQIINNLDEYYERSLQSVTSTT
jgi:ribonuclease T